MTIDEMLKAAGPASCYVPVATNQLITGLSNAVRELQAQIGAITAENVGLKVAVDGFNQELYGQGFQVSGWHLNDALDPLDSWFESNDWDPETPASSSAMAALRAEGVEMFVAKTAAGLRTAGGGLGVIQEPYHEVADYLEDRGERFARQLRESKGANHE